MARALVIVMDSFGCGGAPDAALYDDLGADTLGHIARDCAAGRGDRRGLRSGPLRLPFLDSLGLGAAARLSTGAAPLGFGAEKPAGAWGCASETAKGKDTTSGHWEIAGAPAQIDFGYFPDARPCFPHDLVKALIEQGALPGILGDRRASGLDIIEESGEESLRSGKPICYASVDSVFQIAAHEEAFGLDRLYDLCGIARRLCDPLRIGRVIARPFVGAARGMFIRTAHRRDFAMAPPFGNFLDRAREADRAVLTIGKIGDIFAHRNTGTEIHGAGNLDLFDKMLAAWRNLGDGGLAFANFVDFDTHFGHRRDVAGYAASLEAFDARLPALDPLLALGDLVVITADHGNDPTWRGTDHTRENAPILCYGPRLAARAIGRRASYADVGASVARWLGLAKTPQGTPFL